RVALNAVDYPRPVRKLPAAIEHAAVVTVTTTAVAAINDAGVGGKIRAGRDAIRRRRLLSRRNAVDPDAAHPGRRTLAGRNSIRISPTSLSAGCCGADRNECDG